MSNTHTYSHTEIYVYIHSVLLCLCLPLKFLLPTLPFIFFLLEEGLPNAKWSEGREAHNVFQPQ